MFPWWPSILLFETTPPTPSRQTLWRERERDIWNLIQNPFQTLNTLFHHSPSISLSHQSLSLSLSLYPFSRSSSSLLYLTLPSETVRSIQGKAIQCKLTSIMIIWNVHIKQLDLYLLSIFSYLNGIWRFFFSAFSVVYVLGLFIALIIFWIRVSLGLVEFLHLHVDVFFF